VDGRGNAVSYIQSLFMGFGCGVVAEGTGVLLNNRGCGFSLNPESVNSLQPGKKPVHTLNTYMVFRDGRPVIVGGSPGGDIQVQTNLQVLTALIDFGRDPQQAAEDPRWSRHAGLDVNLEDRAPAAVFEGLASRGHVVHRAGPYGQGGRAQVIRIAEGGGLTAGSDPRCDGCALAF
jgi:gamma-glutamyltranspeptidase/glutathione hydrolase